ncbi:MAG: type II secretion system GspH family protein [Alphaproteobacteria bacterium]|nr:type II secretion system GspH family protein [Alphaproteobacteria bacterium]
MYKNLEKGRSMIEMLGVLAIIGVLSVGGIAGYSKAMEKFKLDKAIEEYSYLIYGMLEHLDEFKYSTKYVDGKTTPLIKLANALNLVPPTWNMKTNNLDSTQENLFEDPYSNIIAIYSRNGNLRFDFVLGGSQFPDESSWITENFSTKFCTELVSNVVKPLHSSLELLLFYRSAGNSSIFYGDKNCSAGRKCLNNISISEIHDNCELCSKKEVCSVTIDF